MSINFSVNSLLNTQFEHSIGFECVLLLPTLNKLKRMRSTLVTFTLRWFSGDLFIGASTNSEEE